MFLASPGVLYTSASDLSTASKCEFAFLRSLDAKLGRIEAVTQPDDPMLVRSGRLGDEHEDRRLQRYREEGPVVEIERRNARDRVALDEAAAETLAAFRAEAPVVFQATFHQRTEPIDGLEIAFLGYADFIVLRDGAYVVQDTKLARSPRVTALLQLAAYAEQLDLLGIPVADTVELLLGDGSVSEHRLRDVAPVFHNRRARLHRIIRERFAADDVVAWEDPRYTFCGHCADCTAEIEASRDVLLVAGLRVAQKLALAAVGVHTIDELAASSGTVDGIGESALAGLRAQARLQLAAVAGEPPPVERVDNSALSAIPAPSPGDLFFDFEGDPLYTEGDATRWGLDYLFGMVSTTEEFTAFWAHDFAQERQALIDFLAHVAAIRADHPDMHIYHYAAYERTHLLSLAARHGVGEEQIDQLLREHVLVDLYPIVRKALRVGSHSYSIKKLEPLYMGAEVRTADVQNAAASIEEYAAAMEQMEAGDAPGGQARLDEIHDYNRYDCVSTLRLRDYLLSLAPTQRVEPVEAPPELVELEETPLHAELIARAGNPLAEHRTPDETAAAFAAAALDYHRREHKSFWWGHFSRLVQHVDEWAETRDVLVVDHARVTRGWYREGRQRSDRREVRLTGTWAPGSSVKPGGISRPYVLYDGPTPFDDPRAEPGARATRQVTVLEVFDDGVLIEETLGADVPQHDLLPMALTPASPPPAGQQKPAIEEWAQTIVDATPAWPRDPATDILRRIPPHTLRRVEPVETAASHQRVEPVETSTLTPVLADDYVTAVTTSLLTLDKSYLAVQGPPGTGKTYLGAHTIKRLVEYHHWKIGVVAQSHAVVENLLTGVVKAGLDPALVAKVTGADDPAFTPLPKDGHQVFALDHATTGFVIGGTAWDFANPARVSRRALDLLVIDEAGQFSLASTIAASVAAKNLLLLGDPQQLPQVSQGLHPEPIDGSALGWISADHDVLPPELGYFLAASRRMHPAMTAPVSELSYEGALHSHPTASLRSLDGVEPGLHIVPVDDVGNNVESPEEADRVVALVRDHLGLAWTDGDTRTLDQHDFIVVSPYNAQVALVREALDAASLPEVRVGTVDKFQGQEAVIAIVTLAASSAADVPRGMSFLIMRNRLNVAISRAQWAAYLVHSPELTEYLPPTPAGVAELSTFIHLLDR